MNRRNVASLNILPNEIILHIAQYTVDDLYKYPSLSKKYNILFKNHKNYINKLIMTNLTYILNPINIRKSIPCDNGTPCEHYFPYQKYNPFIASHPSRTMESEHRNFIKSLLQKTYDNIKKNYNRANVTKVCNKIIRKYINFKDDNFKIDFESYTHFIIHNPDISNITRDNLFYQYSYLQNGQVEHGDLIYENLSDEYKYMNMNRNIIRVMRGMGGLCYTN
jgi:hypothetical protein